MQLGRPMNAAAGSAGRDPSCVRAVSALGQEALQGERGGCNACTRKILGRFLAPQGRHQCACHGLTSVVHAEISVSRRHCMACCSMVYFHELSLNSCPIQKNSRSIDLSK